MNVLTKIDNLLEANSFSLEDIQRNCPKSYNLSTKNNKFLFRGARNLSNNLGMAKIDTNRYPLGSSDMFVLFNRAFKAAFGIEARRQCLFTTGDASEASRFGTVYKIYPADDFTLIYSKSVKYLTADIAYENLDSKNVNEAALKLLTLIYYDELRYMFEDCDSYMQKLIDKFVPNVEFTEEFFDLIDWNEVADDVLGAYPNCAYQFVKKHFKKGSSPSDWAAAVNSKGEVLVSASYYCYEKV